MSAAVMYGPQPEARKERARGQMREAAMSLLRMVEARALTPEQFEMEVRLQIMWLTVAVNDFHEAGREEQLIAKRMRKAGWLL